jgi:hypothetical protein
MSIILVAVVCMGLTDKCRVDYIPTEAVSIKQCDSASQAIMAQELKLEDGEKLYSYSCQEDRE